MSRIKNVIKFFSQIVFVMSLTLLGKFNLCDVESNVYRILVVLLWVSGIFKFMDVENELKDEIVDHVKDLFLAITVVPLWYMISGNFDNSFIEPMTIFLHYIVLTIVLGIVYSSVKTIGSISYVTHGIIPIIWIVLLWLGVPTMPAVIISIIIPEIVNVSYFRRRLSAQANL